MTKLLLLVEDNDSDEKLALLAFRRSGVACEIAVARDGADALDYLFATGKHVSRDPSASPSLILLDLQLPRVSGLEVLRRIRAAPPTRLLPVVVLTASREDEDRLQCYSLGANAYIRKPVDFVEFSEVARALSVFWLRFNELAPAVRST
ncbi:MAG TPA: response regulator [Kofleriaceae bacterium]|nr:response regulator [Kofleriaceae bacterium]